MTIHSTRPDRHDPALRRLTTAIDRLPPVRWVLADPSHFRAILDIGLVVALAAVVLRVAESDTLFHVVFVLLAIHTFAFGYRSALVRTAIAFGAVLLDVPLPGGLSGEEFLTEWPLMFLIAGVTVIMANRRRETIDEYTSLYRQASDRLITAQEVERRRLALDLHDGVGQSLTALLLTLDAANDALPDAAARTYLADARRIALAAIDETRNVSERLRPARLKENGILAALNELAAHSGIHVDVGVEPEVGDLAWLDPSQALGVFRIVQEALNNAARHSGATHARIALRRLRDDVEIDVEDEGRGFHPSEEARGLGLAGMRERAAILGATLVVNSKPGSGTMVALFLPVPPTAPHAISLEATEMAARG